MMFNAAPVPPPQSQPPATTPPHPGMNQVTSFPPSSANDRLNQSFNIQDFLNFCEFTAARKSGMENGVYAAVHIAHASNSGVDPCDFPISACPHSVQLPPGRLPGAAAAGRHFQQHNNTPGVVYLMLILLLMYI